MFSNGDAHFKNFSLIETPLGDYKLSPAYDLLNSRIHMEDNDFALSDGLLPRQYASGSVRQQFFKLGEMAVISSQQVDSIFKELTTHNDNLYSLIKASFLNESMKRNYTQVYQTRINKLLRP